MEIWRMEDGGWDERPRETKGGDITLKLSSDARVPASVPPCAPSPSIPFPIPIDICDPPVKSLLLSVLAV